MSKNLVAAEFENFDDMEVRVDKTALYMPITIKDKPVGFVTNVNKDSFSVAFWTQYWTIEKDDEGNIMKIELSDEASSLPPIDPLFGLDM